MTALLKVITEFEEQNSMGVLSPQDDAPERRHDEPILAGGVHDTRNFHNRMDCGMGAAHQSKRGL
jgi:hypothetical protein